MFAQHTMIKQEYVKQLYDKTGKKCEFVEVLERKKKTHLPKNSEFIIFLMILIEINILYSVIKPCGTH